MFQKIVLGTSTPVIFAFSSYALPHDHDGRSRSEAYWIAAGDPAMAVSAIAFMIVLGIMAIVMPLWQLGKRLISYDLYHRMMQRSPGDMRTDELPANRERKAYYRVLRDLLTEGVQSTFKEQHERPTPRISQLLRQLDQTPAMQPFAR